MTGSRSAKGADEPTDHGRTRSETYPEALRAQSREDLRQMRVVAESLVNRTVVDVVWGTRNQESHGAHEFCRLWLDDGRVIEFGGYGDHAIDWGTEIEDVTEATRTARPCPHDLYDCPTCRDPERRDPLSQHAEPRGWCLSCGQPHGDLTAMG